MGSNAGFEDLAILGVFLAMCLAPYALGWAGRILGSLGNGD